MRSPSPERAAPSARATVVLACAGSEAAATTQVTAGLVNHGFRVELVPDVDLDVAPLRDAMDRVPASARWVICQSEELDAFQADLLRLTLTSAGIDDAAIKTIAFHPSRPARLLVQSTKWLRGAGLIATSKPKVRSLGVPSPLRRTPTLAMPALPPPPMVGSAAGVPTARKRTTTTRFDAVIPPPRPPVDRANRQTILVSQRPVAKAWPLREQAKRATSVLPPAPPLKKPAAVAKPAAVTKRPATVGDGPIAAPPELDLEAVLTEAIEAAPPQRAPRQRRTVMYGIQVRQDAPRRPVTAATVVAAPEPASEPIVAEPVHEPAPSPAASVPEPAANELPAAPARALEPTPFPAAARPIETADVDGITPSGSWIAQRPTEEELAATEHFEKALRRRRRLRRVGLGLGGLGLAAAGLLAALRLDVDPTALTRNDPVEVAQVETEAPSVAAPEPAAAVPEAEPAAVETAREPEPEPEPVAEPEPLPEPEAAPTPDVDPAFLAAVVQPPPRPDDALGDALVTREVRAFDELLIATPTLDEVGRRAANRACRGLEQGGVKEWRLPVASEVGKLVEAGYVAMNDPVWVYGGRRQAPKKAWFNGKKIRRSWAKRHAEADLLCVAIPS